SVKVWPVLVRLPVKFTVPPEVVSVPSPEPVEPVFVKVPPRLSVPDDSLIVPVFCHAPVRVTVPPDVAEMVLVLLCKLLMLTTPVDVGLTELAMVTELPVTLSVPLVGDSVPLIVVAW